MDEVMAESYETFLYKQKSTYIPKSGKHFERLQRITTLKHYQIFVCLRECQKICFTTLREANFLDCFSSWFPPKLPFFHTLSLPYHICISSPKLEDYETKN